MTRLDTSPEITEPIRAYSVQSHFEIPERLLVHWAFVEFRTAVRGEHVVTKSGEVVKVEEAETTGMVPVVARRHMPKGPEGWPRLKWAFTPSSEGGPLLLSEHEPIEINGGANWRATPPVIKAADIGWALNGDVMIPTELRQTCRWQNAEIHVKTWDTECGFRCYERRDRCQHCGLKIEPESAWQ